MKYINDGVLNIYKKAVPVNKNEEITEESIYNCDTLYHFFQKYFNTDEISDEEAEIFMTSFEEYN